MLSGSGFVRDLGRAVPAPVFFRRRFTLAKDIRERLGWACGSTREPNAAENCGKSKP